MPAPWTRDDILELGRAFQPPCVLAAAADWNVFTHLARKPATAAALASTLGADPRALAILLDALVAMQLLDKHEDTCHVPPDVAELLTDTGRATVLPMILHQANCLRRWAQLPRIVQSGEPAVREPSIRGEAADQAAFIGAMHTVSGPLADTVIADIQPIRFDHLLDIGGGSGTWTLAFLQHAPMSTATIFDLPDVVPMAAKRLEVAGMTDRVTLVPGDFYTDELPTGADLALLSAICHQNAREQNRQLFTKIRRALADDGALIIRDIVMDNSHTNPPGGAMFAVNMLTATERGGTWSLDEYTEDLEAAGFTGVEQLREDQWMNAIIRARKK